MLTLRKANDCDCLRVYLWRNRAEDRRWHFDQKPIRLYEHAEWWQDYEGTHYIACNHTTAKLVCQVVSALTLMLDTLTTSGALRIMSNWIASASHLGRRRYGSTLVAMIVGRPCWVLWTRDSAISTAASSLVPLVVQPTKQIAGSVHHRRKSSRHLKPAMTT